MSSVQGIVSTPGSYTVVVEHRNGTTTNVIEAEPIRLGVVQFLNAQPIIAGLDQCEDVQLHDAVPSRLVNMLDEGEVDVALCSSIDYHRAVNPPVILPAPPLGCHGATLTVRLFSSEPLESLERVYCDTDSHTSVVLLQIVMRERFGREVELLPFEAAGAVDWPETVLLIGDKVMTNAPPEDRHPWQLDLGEAWKDMTGLPFLFGVWLARADADPRILRTTCAILDRQYRYNRMHLEGLIARESATRDWPLEVAREYLSTGIRYEFGQEQRAGLDRFYELAEQHGLLDQVRPIQIAAC